MGWERCPCGSDLCQLRGRRRGAERGVHFEALSLAVYNGFVDNTSVDLGCRGGLHAVVIQRSNAYATVHVHLYLTTSTKSAERVFRNRWEYTLAQTQTMPLSKGLALCDRIAATCVEGFDVPRRLSVEYLRSRREGWGSVCREVSGRTVRVLTRRHSVRTANTRRDDFRQLPHGAARP